MKKLFFISMLFSGAMHVNGMNIDNNAFGEAYAENQQQDEQIEISVKKILKEMGFTEVKKLSEALDKEFSTLISNNKLFFYESVKSGPCKTIYTQIPLNEKNAKLSENSKYRQFQSSSLNGRYNWNVLEAPDGYYNWDVFGAPECLMDLHNRIQQWFTENNEGKYTLDKNKIDELAIMIQGTVKNPPPISPNCWYKIIVSPDATKHYYIELLLDNGEKLGITICYEDPCACFESISDLGSISFTVYPKHYYLDAI